MKQPAIGISAHALRRLAALSATAFALSASAQTYPAWKADTYYAAGTLVSYNGHVYKALVNQTDYASTGWNPSNASLWTDLGATAGPAPPRPASHCCTTWATAWSVWRP